MTHITNLKSGIFLLVRSWIKKPLLCDRRLWAKEHLWSFFRKQRKTGEVSNRKLRKREMRRQKYKFLGLLRSPSNSLVIAAQHLTRKYGSVPPINLVICPVILTLFYFLIFRRCAWECKENVLDIRWNRHRWSSSSQGKI